MYVKAGRSHPVSSQRQKIILVAPLTFNNSTSPARRRLLSPATATTIPQNGTIRLSWFISIPPRLAYGQLSILNILQTTLS